MRHALPRTAFLLCGIFSTSCKTTYVDSSEVLGDDSINVDDLPSLEEVAASYTPPVNPMTGDEADLFLAGPTQKPPTPTPTASTAKPGGSVTVTPAGRPSPSASGGAAGNAVSTITVATAGGGGKALCHGGCAVAFKPEAALTHLQRLSTSAKMGEFLVTLSYDDGPRSRPASDVFKRAAEHIKTGAQLTQLYKVDPEKNTSVAIGFVVDRAAGEGKREVLMTVWRPSPERPAGERTNSVSFPDAAIGLAGYVRVAEKAGVTTIVFPHALHLELNNALPKDLSPKEGSRYVTETKFGNGLPGLGFNIPNRTDMGAFTQKYGRDEALGTPKGLRWDSDKWISTTSGKPVTAFVPAMVFDVKRIAYTSLSGGDENDVVGYWIVQPSPDGKAARFAVGSTNDIIKAAVSPAHVSGLVVPSSAVRGQIRVQIVDRPAPGIVEVVNVTLDNRTVDKDGKLRPTGTLEQFQAALNLLQKQAQLSPAEAKPNRVSVTGQFYAPGLESPLVTIKPKDQ